MSVESVVEYIGRNVCYESTRRLFYCDICPPAATFCPSGDNCEISGTFSLDFYLFIYLFFFLPRNNFLTIFIFFPSKLSYKSTLTFYILFISCINFNDVKRLIRHVYVCCNENFVVCEMIFERTLS